MDLPRFRADLARLCDPARDRVLVAVSGGADSLALLLLTHPLLGARCRAATVDHGLRPDARAEAEQVAAICAARGIPHAILAAPLPDRAGRTANLSARARELRYTLLWAHAETTGCEHIATAHHADDQVETLAMRLNRGAGVGGLAGIRASSGRVIRPLLDWRREELAEIVRDAGLRAVEDPSNVDPRFDRARLRADLAGAHWITAERWNRSAAAMADADWALDWAADRLFAERVDTGDTGLTLALDGIPPELARRLVLRCLCAIDPALAPRGDEITRLLDRADGRYTLGRVLVTASPGSTLLFALAPPRRGD